MVDMKTKSDINAMSAAGAVVAEALREVVANADAGRTTADLDSIAAQVLAVHGATSPFLD